ncbi:hypothetical protein FRC09_003670 [Ceratobasidium sp. 395]|nr:hypothetical protein FRC09_003670 [Ceratobasidium sp. 395]
MLHCLLPPPFRAKAADRSHGSSPPHRGAALLIRLSYLVCCRAQHPRSQHSCTLKPQPPPVTLIALFFPMTIVLAHPSQSTLLTRRAGPAAAKRPSPPCWLAWQRDPKLELEDLRKLYHNRTESVRRTVATRRKLAMRSQSSSSSLSSSSSSSSHRRAAKSQAPQTPSDENAMPGPTEKPTALSQSSDAPAPLTPTQEKAQALLGMYSSLLESRLQSVERVSQMLSSWQQHTPLS